MTAQAPWGGKRRRVPLSKGRKRALIGRPESLPLVGCEKESGEIEKEQAGPVLGTERGAWIKMFQ